MRTAERDGPPRAERRLAAVLAADLVGYSVLMERDEEGTHERLRGVLRDLVTPAIERHRGRLVKTTGDGVLAEFASPIEAVRSAVALQQALSSHNSGLQAGQRMTFRVGVNLGDILVEEGDVFGEGVNVAARLEGLAEAGGVLVSHTIHDHVHGKLPFGFEDLGERSLKNIERPIRVYRVTWEPERAAAPAGAGERALPERPAIAVLPFTNMSSDPEQEYFGDGIAEDLITDLSRVPGLMVIARNSSFAYKGRHSDLRAVARDLGARYLVEGSVRRAASRLRINAQLIDTASNTHVWAERFDRDLSDIFVLQDEVVSRIVSALSDALPKNQGVAPRRAANLKAYDNFIRGRALAAQSPHNNRTARPLLESAIEIDPGYAEAHAWLALTHHFAWLHTGEDIDVHRSRALASARRAVALDPENADGHMILGYVRAHGGALAEGIVEFERALRINPNHEYAWALFSDLLVFDGRPLEAIECVQNALRLNPYPRSDLYWLLGFAECAAGRYEDAVETLRQDELRGTGGQRVRAAALAHLGRLEEARKEAAEFMASNPNFSVGRWAASQPFRHEADKQQFVDGYRKAGLPD